VVLLFVMCDEQGLEEAQDAALSERVVMSVTRGMVAFVSHGTALHSLDPLCKMHINLKAAVERMIATSTLTSTSSSSCPCIIIVSAHYSSDFCGVLVSHGDDAHCWPWGTLHDHPASCLYKWKYKATCSSAQSEMVLQTLLGSGLDARIDASRRELDHGAWIALHSLWNDETPCPVVQVSLHGGGSGGGGDGGGVGGGEGEEDLVVANLRLGRSLQKLRSLGMHIVTSGSVTHSQDEFRKSFLSSGAPMHDWTPAAMQKRREACDRSIPFAESLAFDKFVRTAVLAGNKSTLLEAHRQQACFAKVHPEPSHWLPLVVALGCAGIQEEDEAVEVVHHGYQHGLSETSFIWGLPLPLPLTLPLRLPLPLVA